MTRGKGREKMFNLLKKKTENIHANKDKTLVLFCWRQIMVFSAQLLLMNYKKSKENCFEQFSWHGNCYHLV